MKWDRSKGRPEPIRSLNRIRELENGEPLVNINGAAPSLVPLRAGTLTWCRHRVAEMAEMAARSLPRGFRLGYSEAWRPILRQRMIYEFMWAKLEEARPGLDYKTKRRIVCRYVAPVDQKAPPGHCTGAALDVYLRNEAGEQLDLIAPYTRFQASPTYVFGLEPSAQEHRNILVRAMLDAGFSNCRDEFWHYSFGDAGWAVRMGLQECPYGLIELDLAHWADNQRAWEEALKDRPNPFLS